MSNQKVEKTSKNTVWKFASNHLNVALMSSMGIIATKELLGKKYYKDSLSLFDGYIPVFKKVPISIWEYSIQEDKDTLKPCLLNFKKDLIQHLIQQGVIQLPALVQGQWQILDIHNDDFSRVELLLIPAPIALSQVDYIVFHSTEEQKIFHERMQDSVNSVLLTTKVLSREFEQKNNHVFELYQEDYLNGQIFPISTQVNYAFANAIVAVINHLMILLNTNQKASQLFEYIKFGHLLNEQHDKQDQLLIEVADWVRSSGEHLPDSAVGDVFIKLCTNLIIYKNNLNYASAKDIILVSLNEISSQNEQSRIFVDELKNYLQFSNSSLDELLEKYPRTLQRAIILFIARENVLELWQKVGIYHSQIEPLEMLLASILFAISRGWQGFSTAFKQYGGQYNLDMMQQLMSELSRNIRIDSNQTAMNRITMPLEQVWKGTYKGKLKNDIIALIHHCELDCAEDELILPEGVELMARAGKIVIKTKAQSVKVNTLINEEKFLTYLSSLDWFDFEKDKFLQKLNIKK